ncbi:MAG: DUF5615 family PIN-like protein [Geodermatophilaceae bacterium]|nr:DUF5615 family PIN-like protein [Geodermatophilaceae bacterium]
MTSPTKLLLDEMFAPRIAELLLERGIDARAVAADRLLAGADDADIAATALAEGRALVTNNVVDFERLRRAGEAEQSGVPGLIYTSDAAFPRDRRFVSRLVVALTVAAEQRHVEAHGGVSWLSGG